MPKTAVPVLLAAALTFGAVAPLQAQALTPGTWTGTMSNPVGGNVPVTFDVGGTADARDAAGGYAGTCSDGSGSGEGRITMVPPA
jgi:hypothetical protein